MMEMVIAMVFVAVVRQDLMQLRLASLATFTTTHPVSVSQVLGLQVSQEMLVCWLKRDYF